MQNETIKIFEKLTQDYGFLLISVGQAWQNVHTAAPAIELWSNNIRHPGVNGTYLAACVIYSYIFTETPEGSSCLPTFVTKENAAILQKTAYSTVDEYPQQTPKPLKCSILRGTGTIYHYFYLYTQ